MVSASDLFSSASNSEQQKTTATILTVPFTLDPLYDDEDAGNDKYVNLEDEAESSEGIDVVSAEKGPENFFQWCRLSAGKIVRSQWFKRGALFAILINSILMGVATSEWMRDFPDLSQLVQTTINLFQALFTLEILLDIMHYQQEAMQIGWIISDVIILCLSWFVSQSLLVFRSFRLIRALRKASGVAELNHLVESLFRVVPKMLSLVFLVALFFYSFAVVFTDLYQDLYEMNELSKDYFGGLGRSSFTLFQIMTLDGWAEIAKELMNTEPWSCALFLIFIILTSFIFWSLVIAVVGEGFTAVANERINKALEVDHTTLPKTGSADDMRKLEKRVEELTKTMEAMLASQLAIQETFAKHVKDNDAGEDETNHSE